jgi:hypothetical protein
MTVSDIGSQAFTKIPEVAIEMLGRGEIDQRAFAVFAVLCWRRNWQTNKVQIGVRELGKQAGIRHFNTTAAAIDKLTAMGLLTVVDAGAPGRGYRTTYRVNYDPIKGAENEPLEREDKGADSEPLDKEKVQPLRGKGSIAARKRFNSCSTYEILSDSSQTNQGSGGAAGGGSAAVGGGVQIPPALDSPEMRKAWAEWERHCREIKQTLSPTSVERQMFRLAEMGRPAAIKAIHHSIAQNYRGIIAETFNRGAKHARFKPAKRGTTKPGEFEQPPRRRRVFNARGS